MNLSYLATASLTGLLALTILLALATYLATGAIIGYAIHIVRGVRADRAFFSVAEPRLETDDTQLICGRANRHRSRPTTDLVLSGHGQTGARGHRRVHLDHAIILHIHSVAAIAGATTGLHGNLGHAPAPTTLLFAAPTELAHHGRVNMGRNATIVPTAIADRSIYLQRGPCRAHLGISRHGIVITIAHAGTTLLTAALLPATVVTSVLTATVLDHSLHRLPKFADAPTQTHHYATLPHSRHP
jgi:hypothetical protein